MIPLINSQFSAVRGVPVESVSFGDLVAKLESTLHSVVLAHKFVGPLYTTTAYDEVERKIYRVHHPRGILNAWKLVALTNPRIRILKTGQKYNPKEAK